MRSKTKERIEALERQAHQHIDVKLNAEPEPEPKWTARRICVRWDGTDQANQWVVTVDEMGWPAYSWGYKPSWTPATDFAPQAFPTPLAAYKAGLKHVKAFHRKLADAEILLALSSSQEFTKVIP